MRHSLAITLVLLFVVVAGCIVSDEVTTLTIYPDGSADLVIFRSNIRSTLKGTDATNQLAKFKEDFAARRSPEFARIEQAGGTVLEADWIRQEAPFSNYLHAFLKDAAALEDYASVDGGQHGLSIHSRLKVDGRQRELTIEIVPPADGRGGQPASPQDVEQLLQELANGLSVVRLAVVDGAIEAANGFQVSSDKQSALLDTRKFVAIMQGSQSEKLFLRWQVTPSRPSN